MIGRIALGFFGLCALASGFSCVGQALSPPLNPAPSCPENGADCPACGGAEEAADLQRECDRLRDENRRLREDKGA